MAERLFGSGYFNLLRRGADGSLVLSADKWRLAAAGDPAWQFEALDSTAPPLQLAMNEVREVTFDRLPRQQVRSQIRFLLTTGDLWTFSGVVDASAVPEI